MTRRILVIDDEKAIHIIVKASLEVTAGWEVLVADSARAGIAIAETDQPGTILLDVMMPELDGPAVLRKLQTKPATQNIPVIFLTAKARNGEKRLFESMGVAGVITKPFEPDQLANQIKTLLHWPD
ncbi:response regulator receiver protein [Leptolyngbya sp. Heron Island J]|uniref:response regulator n=1 Tax=Leptolyngbya sp. Heron Island J TaxID=1385935 RepID=UPI0003B9DB45|nr:response regulator [Leptolyngbya sp. Heron Island J]ESA37481.1 response regulator receiver protein [Leptolyngbya sp. Heron Island J]